MLNELKNLKYLGGKEELVFFISDVIGNKSISMQDAEVICSHTSGKHYLSVNNLVDYCLAFGWINLTEGKLSLAPELLSNIPDENQLNKFLVTMTVKRLFDEKVIRADMFGFDAVENQFLFKNELLPLTYSCLRNVLISQGFILPERDNKGATRFHVALEYYSLISEHCKTQRKEMTLEKLKKKLEQEEQAGEDAEIYVLGYEKKRIGEPLCNEVRRISEIDVLAGYDIVSFDIPTKRSPKRFIEVKAVSNRGFFWSKNEYEVAKLKGDTYYLYLVELGRVNNPDYKPEIVQNPAINVMMADNWLVEPESFFVKKV